MEENTARQKSMEYQYTSGQHYFVKQTTCNGMLVLMVRIFEVLPQTPLSLTWHSEKQPTSNNPTSKTAVSHTDT
jgi:hypothetical protein